MIPPRVHNKNPRTVIRGKAAGSLQAKAKETRGICQFAGCRVAPSPKPVMWSSTRPVKTRTDSPGASKLRGASWSAAVSRAERDQPQRVGPSSRVEYFGRSHSCEAAAAGLRHSRGPGAGRHGLRREAERHAAFVRAKVLKSLRLVRAGESAVAAGALPAQSKTRTDLLGASELRGASWTAAVSRAVRDQP